MSRKGKEEEAPRDDNVLQFNFAGKQIRIRNVSVQMPRELKLFVELMAQFPEPRGEPTNDAVTLVRPKLLARPDWRDHFDARARFGPAGGDEEMDRGADHRRVPIFQRMRGGFIAPLHVADLPPGYAHPRFFRFDLPKCCSLSIVNNTKPPRCHHPPLKSRLFGGGYGYMLVAVPGPSENHHMLVFCVAGYDPRAGAQTVSAAGARFAFFETPTYVAAASAAPAELDGEAGEDSMDSMDDEDDDEDEAGEGEEGSDDEDMEAHRRQKQRITHGAPDPAVLALARDLTDASPR
jgi:hypothetical protein